MPCFQVNAGSSQVTDRNWCSGILSYKNCPGIRAVMLGIVRERYCFGQLQNCENSVKCSLRGRFVVTAFLID